MRQPGTSAKRRNYIITVDVRVRACKKNGSGALHRRRGWRFELWLKDVWHYDVDGGAVDAVKRSQVARQPCASFTILEAAPAVRGDLPRRAGIHPAKVVQLHDALKSGEAGKLHEPKIPGAHDHVVGATRCVPVRQLALHILQRGAERVV